MNADDHKEREFVNRCWANALNGAAKLFDNRLNRDQTYTGAQVAAILRAEATA